MNVDDDDLFINEIIRSLVEHSSCFNKAKHVRRCDIINSIISPFITNSGRLASQAPTNVILLATYIYFYLFPKTGR